MHFLYIIHICIYLTLCVCVKLLLIISNDYGAENSDLTLARPNRENSLSFNPNLKIKRSEGFILGLQTMIGIAYAMADGSEPFPILTCFVRIKCSTHLMKPNTRLSLFSGAQQKSLIQNF